MSGAFPGDHLPAIPLTDPPVEPPRVGRPSESSIGPAELPVLREDAEAVVRARAFRAMYDGHVDFVWRNLRRLGVPESEADDRTQEVFVVAHRRFGEYVERGRGPRAWLFQISLRIASDARRHRRRHPEEPDGGDALHFEAVPPEQADAIARREALARLDQALATIEVGRRAVLVLHEIEEMTAPEVAQVLGIPLNTVYSRLRVARGELEAALARLHKLPGDEA